MIESQSHTMLTIWRRHTGKCAHRNRGRDYLKCNCPLWADGYVNGKRTQRRSLGTSDIARARKKAIAMESDEKVYKPVEDAVTTFLANRKSEGLQETSIRKYDNTLDKLKEFCEAIEVDSLSEIDTERLDRFRAGRGLAQITASKELELLRVFFGFCLDRNWIRENPAKKIKSPRNIKGMMWCRSPRAKSRRFYRPAKGLEGNRMSGCEHARWFSRFVILRSE